MDYDYDDCELTPQQRKKKKQEEILLVKAKLKTAQGSITPIEVKPRAKIAKSFWAKKWYENLSTYEDLDYRLQMGRSLLSQNAVVDFQASSLSIEAKVYDQTIHNVKITFKEICQNKKEKLAQAFQKELCSLAELLLGKVSSEICELIVNNNEVRLFPTQEEISFDCDCPDYASLCSHVSACLCAVVVLFDKDPQIFFDLRGIDPKTLVKEQALKVKEPTPSLAKEDLSKIFGIDLAD